MRSSWDPLSLAFSDRELESHYSKYLSVHVFSHVDLTFAYFGGIFTSVVLAWGTFKGLFPSNSFTHTILCGICGGAGIFGLTRNHRSWFLKHRTLIMLFLRTVRIGLPTYLATFLPREKPDWSPLGFIPLFAGFLTYWTIGMPLIFQFHVMHHSAALMFAFLHLQQAFCGCGQNELHRVFHYLSISNSSNLQEEEQCRRVVLFVLFVVGFAVPTYILWYMELKSRVHFMTKMRVSVVGRINVLYMAILLLCSCGLIWVLLFFNL